MIRDLKTELLQGSIGWGILKMAVPTMGGFACISIVNIVDAYFIGSLGEAALAGAGVAIPISMLVHSIPGGVFMASTSLSAKALGEEDTRKARRITSDSLALNVFGTMLIVSLVFATLTPLLEAMNAQGEVLQMAKAYLRLSLPSQILLSLEVVCTGAMRARGDSITPAMILLLAAVLNTVGDFLLVQGNFGFPELGVAGAALATGVAWLASSTTALLLASRRDRVVSLIPCRTFHGFIRMIASWRAILIFAAPLVLARLLVPVSGLLVVAIIGTKGDAAQAAYMVASRIESFLLMVGESVALVIMVFVGQNLGAGFVERVRGAMRFSAGQSACWGLLCSLVFALFGETIAGFFAEDPQLVSKLAFCLLCLATGVAGRVYVGQVSAMLTSLGRPNGGLSLQGIQLSMIFIPLAFFGGVVSEFRGVLFGISGAGLLSFALAHWWLKGQVDQIGLLRQASSRYDF